jgi:vesicle-fusing ATPase
MAMLRSTGLLNNEYAFRNRIYLSSKVFTNLQAQGGLSSPTSMDVKIKHYIVKAEPLPEDPNLDDEHFGISGPYREMLNISKLDEVLIEPVLVKKNKLLSHVDMNVDVIQTSGSKKNGPFDVKESELEKLLRTHTKGLIFNKHQVFLLRDDEMILKCTVTKIQLVEAAGDKKKRASYGFVEEETEMSFKGSLNSSKIMKIKSDKLKEKEIFKKNFNFQEMGIGGLDKEFEEIFRRAFNSRRYPQAVLEKYGIKHVKGMLLYGPPGTGKTLIARQIAFALE